MKIRLGILDNDKLYKTRLINYFNANYADKLELFSFSSMENLMQYLDVNKLDVVLASESAAPQMPKLPQTIAFAYWSESANVESIHGVKVVCKYQKAELIYKEILGLYAEVENDIVYHFGSTDGGMVICFVGAAGGVGTSTVAAGSAMYFARHGKKALYLDLTEMGDAGQFFSGEGNANLSDALYAVKSSKTNIFLKLESMVKRDNSGVNFFDSCKVALDMRDAKPEDLKTLVKVCAQSGSFDVICVDVDSAMGQKLDAIFEVCNAITFVCDSAPISIAKLVKMMQAYSLDQNEKTNVLRKAYLIYNRFHSNGHKPELEFDVQELGGINVFKNGTPVQVAQQIAEKTVFERYLAQMGG